jgi:hypothetical protein
MHSSLISNFAWIWLTVCDTIFMTLCEFGFVRSLGLRIGITQQFLFRACDIDFRKSAERLAKATGSAKWHKSRPLESRFASQRLTYKLCKSIMTGIEFRPVTNYEQAKNANHGLNFFLLLDHIFTFIYLWLYSPLLDLGRFFSFLIRTQLVGLLGRGISPSQGCYLHTGQHKHRINAHIDIHALSGIRTHDPSVQAGEGSLCLRPSADCDRLRIFALPDYKRTQNILTIWGSHSGD